MKYTPASTVLADNFTKRALVLEIYYLRPDLPQKDIVDIVQHTFDGIQSALAQGRTCEFRNFGVLTPIVRKARPGRNPNKPADTVMIPARVVVKFKAGRVLKQQLAKLGTGGAK